MPLELCLTELKQKKKLTEEETATIIKHTAVPATERADYIRNWVVGSDIKKDPVLKEYNIDVDLQMMKVEGRVLDAPDVEYTPNSVVRNIAEKGSWDHRNLKFKNPVSIKRWIIINNSPRTRSLDGFIDMFIRVGSIHGMKIEAPLYVSPLCRNDREFADCLRKSVATNKQLDLVVAVFGGKTNNYKTLKTMGDLELGVPTQGVAEKNVYKLSDQTISNILLKVNTKLKGRNFSLHKNSKK
jgi:eukaryotic translation initiation factor 2C